MTKSMRMGIGAGLASVLLLAGCSSSSSGSGSTGTEGSSAAAPASSSSSTSSSSSAAAGTTAATQIKASLAAAKAAKTVHLAGAGKSSGQTLALDVHYGANGASGFITMSGAKITLIFIGPTVYFKAPDSFYRKTAGANADAVIKLVSGKWVKAPANSTAAKGFSQLADRQTLLNSFASAFNDADAANLHQTGSSSVDGVSTTTYTDSSQKGTLDIASSGTPYPMKLVTTGSDAATITFTDWNKPFPVSAPPASQTVKLPG